MARFVVKNKDELQKKEWFHPPGDPGIQFYCSQALSNEVIKITDKAKTVALDSEGNAIIISSDKKTKEIAETRSNTETLNGIIEMLQNHVHDWKGNDLVDTSGKPLKFSPENLENFLLMYGGEKVILEDGEESSIIVWLQDTVTDSNSFIKGDLKNSRATSTQE